MSWGTFFVPFVLFWTSLPRFISKCKTLTVTTWERTLSVYIGQITFSNQAYKKSPRTEGVRL
jgi:hypothetical protein